MGSRGDEVHADSYMVRALCVQLAELAASIYNSKAEWDRGNECSLVFERPWVLNLAETTASFSMALEPRNEPQRHQDTKGHLFSSLCLGVFVVKPKARSEMGTINIELPDSVLLATHQSREEFVREAKLTLAARLFEQGRISSGKGAEICGIPRVDFLLEMGRRGIPVIQMDEEELKREFEDA